MKWSQAIAIIALGLSEVSGTQTLAQIIPDSTLPINSDINLEQNRLIIRGGTEVGTNLFHSFSEFNIDAGNEAYFTPVTGIETIISRVTGENPSKILGTLGVLGDANLFFLNPNGILFGVNAQLNLNGSFIASTANRLLFADGTQFSTVPTSYPPLLTISTPIGLGLIKSSGGIRVEGEGHQLNALNFMPITDNSIGGLTVQPGRTLALIGNQIDLDGAILTAFDGHIVLAAVNEGDVTFSAVQKGEFNFQAISQFNPINLTTRSAINASGITGGTIELWGNQISFADGSVAFIQTLGFPLNNSLSQPGKITVNATEQFQISGTDPIAQIVGFLRTETLGAIPGSSINIFTPNLNLIQGGGLFTVSYGSAQAGALNLDITDTLNIIGYSPRTSRALSTITSITFSDEAAGDITINAGKLRIQSGGLVLSATGGKGDGGTIQITANDLELDGINPEIFSPSGIGSSSGGTGDAARVTIQTDRLTLKNGGRIDSSTLAQGDAGTISINATDYVSLSGQDTQSQLPSSIVSSADILNPLFRDSFNFPDGSQLSGKSGTINITSPQIYIDDRSEVRVTNLGTGDAGSIVLDGNLIRLTNKGSITAETQSGTGGNIEIGANTLLLQNSQISATARNAGDGGNITTDTENLIVIESRIAADAFKGSGGNIRIATQGLFIKPQSQISASSELGVDGDVELVINEPGVAQGLIEIEPGMASDVDIAQSCIGQTTPNATQLTRSGGRSLPMSPGVGLSEWAIPTPTPTPAPLPLREANTIITLADGQLVLAYVAPVTYRSAQELVCDDS
ncbi:MULTISPECIES: filamentous hemagglutinin N-terminal domain-containing protein [unclassified Coleofasciculus]|uniref:two-partner secretion domain-containing protein n=1 Tax=unclassified Coleofasciculus TaxID=2692782 RepID=UPI001882CE95|nr:MULTISPECIES: filamentous hemagglutinin N-terminal domain-containing protein [unclassified Coleofasciculus]MBE9128505.1 filamentous hemagglutinin N-terminal domain-containing protein [Coleofasciculus sp. LEGE 07081]MBE9151060.1 filamentous hemagglutinin N-terminal domain-containing protein [Coleofasciculus sp. LEGE 07092]